VGGQVIASATENAPLKDFLTLTKGKTMNTEKKANVTPTLFNQLALDLEHYRERAESYNDTLDNWDYYYGSKRKDSVGMTKSDIRQCRDMCYGKIAYIETLIAINCSE
jgi:hypothetical protein